MSETRAAFRAAFEPFAGSDAEHDAVARMAADLAASGRYERDAGRALTPEGAAGHLCDAPDEGVASRWNWWVGSLDLAYGGYAEFVVRRWRE
ncbi:hypothetical protein GCM10009037_11030 [Halarchaeum grantii]|uniref:Uncharacterized protein n=1 Tax=Halarchaeum grantii TaxID=1193105 RepID=A0A830F857_9EURY|nr:hypothetical protein [Halarchaeum grantii]GGL29094.1 hypothetical protein GCM10009037_11030 [Halarchaeum grantii]